ARPSLAVLPFDNLSPDPDNAYFAAGIHEEMLTRLSKVEDLSLRGRTSVMQYQDSRKDLRQIGRELRARYVLEGSVRRAGDRVGITAQLIDAEVDEHVWAESYERQLSDIFQIQADVASRVVEELKGVLTPEERTELSQRPTENLEAYAQYLRGHQYV
ncbi:MAG: adenylate/guanylate cyclase domain-containing protein, partial [Gemmatimonadetes bacterium]|nr:adenylate/guanylate cyclase domain-containing protein [Gemmatimonadota bacterium]